MIQDIGFWVFLAFAVAVYWLLPLRVRSYFLSAISFLLVLVYDPLSGLILVLMSGALFALMRPLGSGSRRGALALVFIIVILAVPLIVFKLSSAYDLLKAGGSVLRFAVPLGMSYYVFRMLHLAIEVFRKTIDPPGFRNYLSYIFLFTIFMAGPIQRYDEFVQDRSDAPQEIFFREGLTRIAGGLIKQTAGIDVIVGLQHALMHSSTTDIAGRILKFDTWQLWVLAISTYLISYLNLSAYTDIAIGSSRLFGLKIMENFNYPIAATSLTDFWRRWHMSLSNWCQTYIFSPVLGATRNPYIALIASFQVMGLWHMFTVNRVVWGLYQALGLSVLSLLRGRKRSKVPVSRWRTGLNWIVTQAYVASSFLLVVIERDNNLPSTFTVLGRALTFGLIH